MWIIKPQETKKGEVMVKIITRFPKSPEQIQRAAAQGKSSNPFGRLENPIVQVLISNQRKNETVMKIQYTPAKNRWVLVHPSKWEHPTFIDRYKRKVPDVLAEKVEVKGLREVFDSRADLDARIAKFTGPDFAEEVLAMITLTAREVTDAS